MTLMGSGTEYNANKLEGEKINTLIILNKTNIRSLNNNYSTRLNISWLLGFLAGISSE